MRPLGVCLFAVLFLLVPVRPAGAEWVIAGYFGIAATSRTYLAVTQSASHTSVRFDPVDYEGRSFTLPPYYGYRGAYFFVSPGWFGLEGEVIHMKVFARTGEIVPASGTIDGAPIAAAVPLDGLVQRFSISHGQNMLLVNAVARHAFGECGDFRTARLVALARVGAGPTLPHVESTIGGVADERYERGSFGFQAAGGVELLLWKKLHVLAEYKLTRCRQSVRAAAGASVETLLTSHHFVFGASWHF
jgi:lipid A oxidase